MSTTQPETRLDRAEIAAADPTDQLADVLSIPEHLRDALWKAESADVKPWDSPGGLIVAGMGGSAIGGRLARAILGDQASRPVLSVAGYALPPWTTQDSTVLCISYSGDTEETLACFEAAGVLGAGRIVATTGGALAQAARAEGVPVIPMAGGLQPRAAVAYSTVAALEAAAICGAGPKLTTEIDVAADHLEQLAVAWGPESPGGERGQGARPRAARDRPGVHRGRPHARDRLPLEDAGQRERQAARVLERAARVRPQRDRRLVLGRPSRPLQRRLPRRLRRHAARARSGSG